MTNFPFTLARANQLPVRGQRVQCRAGRDCTCATTGTLCGSPAQEITRMPDLSKPFLLHLKGWLFLCIGIVASCLLLAETPSIKVALLLGLAIWAFCRFYYFAFYVIEHYVDPGYRFAGLIDFIKYLLRRRRSGAA